MIYLLDKLKLFILGVLLFCSLSVTRYSEGFDYFMVIFFIIILLLNLIPMDCKLTIRSQYIQLILLVVNILTILMKKDIITHPYLVREGIVSKLEFLSCIFILLGSIFAILITLILIIKLKKESLQKV